VRYVTFDQPGAPDVLRVGETEKPSPAQGEVLIAVEAAGVSHADVMQRRGTYPPPSGASNILGLDVAGTIAAIGDGVVGWNVGDGVCALTNGGGYAEFVAVPQGQVLPIPSGWGPVEATTLPENGFTVFDNMVTRARLLSNEIVLVHGGAGGIGSMAIMFARALGADAIATAGSNEKCQACLRIGAKHAINYKTEDFVAETLRVTDDCGADVIVDVVYGDYLAKNIRALAMDGRIACVATQAGITAALAMPALMQRRGTIFGTSMRPRTSEEKKAIADQLRRRIWPLLPARDRIVPLVDRTFTFAEAAEAHRRMEASEHIGKMVLVP
jgi:NADPH2:quinone reductase